MVQHPNRSIRSQFTSSAEAGVRRRQFRRSHPDGAAVEPDRRGLNRVDRALRWSVEPKAPGVESRRPRADPRRGTAAQSLDVRGASAV